MKRITGLLCLLLLIGQAVVAQPASSPERRYWLHMLDKVARPVLSNLAAERLKRDMPVVVSEKSDNPKHRTEVAYLEAFARTLSGISPWLNGEGGAPDEMALRNQYRQWSVLALQHATDPRSPDYLQWSGGQPLVDAAFLSLALIRCPWLWQHTDSLTRQQVVTAFKQTRATVPVYSNWVLFSAMVEAFFCRYGYDYDPVRIEYAVRSFANEWYVGDGMFGDGPRFAMDYYNSIVIHPFLFTVVTVANEQGQRYRWLTGKLQQAQDRYAVLQERNIHTDGSYPVVGRSIVYRGGVFHHLADMALRRSLPPALQPAQVRGALGAVIRKTLDAPNTFNTSGWLQVGLHGAQPGLAEPYITTGSLYLCTAAFLPLGLPATDPFWTAPDAPWTAVKVWGGTDLPADHALDLNF